MNCRRCGAPITDADARDLDGLCLRCDHVLGDIDYGTEEDREDGAGEVEFDDDLADAEEE